LQSYYERVKSMAEPIQGNPNPQQNPQHNEESAGREQRGRRATGSRLGDETGTALREGISETGDVLHRETPNLATAALIGVGVAVLEPELIPGLLVGAGITLAPRLLPAIGTLLRPLVKVAVKTGYELTSGLRETAAEVREQFEDMVAEAQAEHEERAQPRERRAPAEPESAAEAARRPRRPQPQPA
jgi:hypothetical protein